MLRLLRDAVVGWAGDGDAGRQASHTSLRRAQRLLADAAVTAPALVIDDVVAQAATLGGSGVHSLSGLVGAVPPFARTFVEATVPASGAWRELRAIGCHRIGGLVWAVDLSSRSIGGDAIDDALDAVGRDTSVGARWGVRFDSVVEINMPGFGIEAVGPIHSVATFVDDLGALVGGGKSGAPAFLLEAKVNAPLTEDEFVVLEERTGAFFGECLFAFALAACKNAAMVETESPYPSRQARRAAERRGDPPPSKFYTLRIDPNTTRRPALRAPEGGPKRLLSLHIARGHFQTYTEQRPMFGKHAGTFWVPAHVRGSAEAGIVAKDYAVKAPKVGT